MPQRHRTSGAFGCGRTMIKGGGENKMQREYAIRQLAKREGYRLEKKGDDSYRLINARFNVAVYNLDRRGINEANLLGLRAALKTLRSRCPLWVIRDPANHRQGRSMSAVTSIADIDWRLDNVRQALKRPNPKLIYINNTLRKL
jgi:hypothetical protein